MTDYHQIEQSWMTEYGEWQKTIRVSVNDPLIFQIKTARRLLSTHEFMFSIDINTPVGFIHDDDAQTLNDHCRYDVEKLTVYKTTVYLSIQSKWDASYQAEYDLTEWAKPQYEVQHYTLCDGWVNTWLVYDEDHNAIPYVFDTRKQAQDELDNFLHEMQRDIERGERKPCEGYDRDEFRIVIV